MIASLEDVLRALHEAGRVAEVGLAVEGGGAGWASFFPLPFLPFRPDGALNALFRYCWR